MCFYPCFYNRLYDKYCRFVEFIHGYLSTDLFNIDE